MSRTVEGSCFVNQPNLINKFSINVFINQLNTVAAVVVNNVLNLNSPTIVAKTKTPIR